MWRNVLAGEEKIRGTRVWLIRGNVRGFSRDKTCGTRVFSRSILNGGKRKDGRSQSLVRRVAYSRSINIARRLITVGFCRQLYYREHRWSMARPVSSFARAMVNATRGRRLKKKLGIKKVRLVNPSFFFWEILSLGLQLFFSFSFSFFFPLPSMCLNDDPTTIVEIISNVWTHLRASSYRSRSIEQSTFCSSFLPLRFISFPFSLVLEKSRIMTYERTAFAIGTSASVQ